MDPKSRQKLNLAKDRAVARVNKLVYKRIKVLLKDKKFLKEMEDEDRKQSEILRGNIRPKT